MIIVRANLGLANRMRVINSCLVLSKKLNTNIRLIWERKPELNCGFDDLFYPLENTEVCLEDKRMSYFSTYMPDHSPTVTGRIKKIRHKIRKIGHTYFNDGMVQEKRFDDGFWLSLKGNIYIDSCHDFLSFTKENNSYQSFKPRESLQDKIDTITSSFKGKEVGIHIRRTDNLPAIERSKTITFIERMENILKDEPACIFYLSTDDPETERNIRRQFGNHIISYQDKNLDRNSKEGICDAVVDLYALSNTQYIIGSWNSSFSIIASFIKDIPRYIIE